jgi:cytochrome c
MERRAFSDRQRRLCAVVGVLMLMGAAACTRAPGEERALRMVPGGDPELGLRLISHYGCHTCHIVPGIRDVEGLVGPPLIHWSRRTYIAGRLHNTPDNLIHWIYDPQGVDPQTAMPDVGATPQEARHMAAYLFTLR